MAAWQITGSHCSIFIPLEQTTEGDQRALFNSLKLVLREIRQIFFFHSSRIHCRKVYMLSPNTHCPFYVKVLFLLIYWNATTQIWWIFISYKFLNFFLLFYRTVFTNIRPNSNVQIDHFISTSFPCHAVKKLHHFIHSYSFQWYTVVVNNHTFIFTHSCAHSEMKKLWYQGHSVLAVFNCSASWEWACVFESLFQQYFGIKWSVSFVTKTEKRSSHFYF